MRRDDLDYYAMFDSVVIDQFVSVIDELNEPGYTNTPGEKVSTALLITARAIIGVMATPPNLISEREAMIAAEGIGKACQFWLAVFDDGGHTNA